MPDREAEIFRSLLSAAAVRERCNRLGGMAAAGRANWFAIDEQGFERCVEFVRETCVENYPDLDIPLHSRWRHFEVEDVDLWRHHTRDFDGDRLDLARSAVDLAFVSVLLDAGSGGEWRFTDPVSGCLLTRSEGLAAASVALFFDRLADFDSDHGWRVDADSLLRLGPDSLARAFQHSRDNPLLGLDGRLQLLHGLARVLQANRQGEIEYLRPGSLVDECLALAVREHGKPSIEITRVLSIVLNRFGDMWPSGYRRDGVNLGDCGYHSLLASDAADSGVVPFHKLSQWLTYSLIEPLRWAGFEVTDLDGLTGLPEYRNGGLFIDSGALRPLDDGLSKRRLELDSEAVVEWRALTVYLLDRVATSLREKLQTDDRRLPLGSVLQGGTWAAGRRIASQLRADGSPPLALAIDGTIF